MSWRESPAETGLDMMQFKSTPKVHMSNPRLYGTYYICNQKDCNRVEPGAIQWRRSRHLQYCETLWNNHIIIKVVFFVENQTNLNNADWKITSVIVHKYTIINIGSAFISFGSLWYWYFLSFYLVGVYFSSARMHINTRCGKKRGG